VARYSGKLLLSLVAASLATLSGWVVLGRMGIGLPLWLVPSSPGEPDFGFSAHYVIPNPFPEAAGHCDFGSPYGPSSVRWTEGPQSGFDELDPSRIARDSLAWFEESPDAATWLVHESVALELDYPSENRMVNVRRARSAEHGWEEQLRAWFYRIPPSSESEPSWGGDFSWTVTFGEHGEVRGDAHSAEEGVAALRAWIPEPEGSAFFAHPTFDLGQMVRADAHTMNWYSVETSLPEEIDELPRRLREQRGGLGSRLNRESAPGRHWRSNRSVCARGSAVRPWPTAFPGMAPRPLLQPRPARGAALAAQGRAPSLR
jgi:hypothetical protein